MSRTKAEKKRRKQIKQEALEMLAKLSDADLKNLRHEVGREMAMQSVKINDLRVRLEAIRSEQERRGTLTPAGIHITDHALVRFLERVKGVDVESARAEIGEMAKRARSEKDGRMGRRRDPITGLVVGVDETTTNVTTVFGDDEMVALKL
jgi:hypothetical protein